MKIGIGTYALFWEISDSAPEPLSLAGTIDRAAELGCEVFQICDDPRIETENSAGLAVLRERAGQHSLELELGTRSVAREHLARCIGIAEELGARTLRSMVQAHEISAGWAAVVEELRAVLPLLDAAGVTLALETYEQIPTSALIGVIEAVASPSVRLCLDPANCVPSLEHPREVVEACAPHTANLHVKDFAFTRRDGWVGFTYSGTPLGEGLLDLDHELATVYAEDRAPSAIVEHWLPWQGDIDATLAVERDWTERSLARLRTWRESHTS